MRASALFRLAVALPRAAVVTIASLALLTNAVADDFQKPPLVKPGSDACLESGFVYPLEGRPTPQCHASTIVETPTGLVVAWFGGAHEKNNDVGVWVSRKESSGWTKPVQVATGAEDEARDFPCWNPVLFQMPDGPLLLFYKVGPSPSQWWGVVMASSDGGRTWNGRHRLGTSDKLGEKNPNLIGPVKNKPVLLADGALLCPSSTEHRGWRVHFEISRDQGKTWKVIGPINDASRFDAIQPSILDHGDGSLQILCRSQQGAIVESWSKDGGATWSPLAKTKLPNPNAGTDAVTLRDGRHVLVYNHLTRGRRMLNVAISDDGRTWKPTLTLEDDPGRAEFSYPAVIQTANGHLSITYTWRRQTVKHVVLDPSQL